MNIKKEIRSMEDLKFNSMTIVTVLTGAGISAESGIKTFRDSDGLWENYDVEKVATPEAFEDNPVLVWDFYKQRYQNAISAKPNLGHYALVDLELKLGAGFNLITQNIDGLHKAAGSKNVIEMHGSLYKCSCVRCSSKHNILDIDLTPAIPTCPKCNGKLRPDVVWFGEIPYHLEEIERLLRRSDVFIVIGTSGVVYPAAGFVQAAKYQGATTVGINLEKPDNLKYFDFFYPGRAGDILPGLVIKWLSEISHKI